VAQVRKTEKKRFNNQIRYKIDKRLILLSEGLIVLKKKINQPKAYHIPFPVPCFCVD